MKTEKNTSWVIDPSHSEITFRVKHMMISTVTGQFENFSGTVHTDGDDFFHAGSFPKTTFRSKNFDGKKLTGDITIRETTREITLETEFNGIAVDPYGQTKAGFELKGELNRKEFGLKWDAVTEAGNVVVSDKVTLVIGAQFIKQ